jgi:hypothetical protein
MNEHNRQNEKFANVCESMARKLDGIEDILLVGVQVTIKARQAKRANFHALAYTLRQIAAGVMTRSKGAEALRAHAAALRPFPRPMSHDPR